MAEDLLSQGEIDALMAGLASEQSAEEETSSNDSDEDGSDAPVSMSKRDKKIKRYDFKRPDRFNKDQLRMIEMMHESFARHFGAALSTYIRTIAEIKVLSVKQATYAEYVRTVPNPSAINVFSVEPLKGTCILEINPTIVFTIIDRILGGPGNPMAKERELTDIEQVIVGKVAVKALDTLHDCWNRVVIMTPEIKTKETNIQFVQLVAPNEMVLVIRFQLTVKDQSGEMSICLPYITLEPVISKLSTHSWFTTGGKGTDPKTQENLKARLNLTAVPVSVRVGGSTLTTRELMNLKVGDVVKLDAGVQSDLDIFVENRRIFGGRPGISSHKKAVMITQVYEPNPFE
jgi:flagellar motor switch protein FliM